MRFGLLSLKPVMPRLVCIRMTLGGRLRERHCFEEMPVAPGITRTRGREERYAFFASAGNTSDLITTGTAPDEGISAPMST